MRWGRTSRRIFCTALLAVAIALTAAPAAIARRTLDDDRNATAAFDDARDEHRETAPESKDLFTVLKQGGLMMIPLFACSFLTFVFVFERAISLRRGRVIPAPLVKRFLHQIRESKLDREGALELCQESQCPVSDVFAAGVRKWGRPAVEVEQSLLDAEERAAHGLRRYVRLFAAIANISPLLGLLGTVMGMIRLFGDVARSDAMGRSELLAAGISEALLATAGGLMVAIPALCFHLFFASRVERLVAEIDSAGQELVGLISAESLQEDRVARAARANRRGAAA